MKAQTEKSDFRGGGFHIAEYLLLSIMTAAVFCICVCVGSVNVPLKETVMTITEALGAFFSHEKAPKGMTASIILSVRIPRVLCVAMSGAALALAGAAMQGLLKNPLADGSTIGVSSGAALGAVVSIAFGITFPRAPFAGTMILAILFAFGSLVIILVLARWLDYTVSNSTIILVGIIFSMFVSSIMDIIITFSPEHIQNIAFWTMGSLQGKDYSDAAVIAGALVLFGGLILFHTRELNAFAMGEDRALHIGVNVRRTRLLLLIAISGLIGVCVAIGGTIGFVGLIIPHMSRMLVGPNHRRLLPASLFGGAIFLMLADLVARTLFKPMELPIGVVTSLVGAVVFIFIFSKSRKEQ